MRLKLNELQREVKKLIKEEKNADTLAAELTRSLGPTILTTHGIRLMAESVNNRLDYLDQIGKNPSRPKVSLLLRFADSGDSEVRKMVARLLPENFLRSMMWDRNSSVRSAVARRLPASMIREMCKRFPSDDQLVAIEKQKRLHEAGLPNPELEDEEFDMYGDINVGKVEDDTKLSNAWYDTMAHKIILQYGGNIEGHWEELAVARYCRSVDPLQQNIDHLKLYKTVKDKLAAAEKEALEENISLKSIAKRLLEEEAAENISVMPVISESIDPLRSLVESRKTSSDYMQEFESIFAVKKFFLENPARRMGLFEGHAQVLCPVTAFSPSRSLDVLEENALDMYVKYWNSQHTLQGGNNILSWYPHPEQQGKISFNLEIK